MLIYNNINTQFHVFSSYLTYFQCFRWLGISRMELIFQGLLQLLLILSKTVMMLIVVLVVEKQPVEEVGQQELTYEIPRRNASYKW